MMEMEMAKPDNHDTVAVSQGDSLFKPCAVVERATFAKVLEKSKIAN